MAGSPVERRWKARIWARIALALGAPAALGLGLAAAFGWIEPALALGALIPAVLLASGLAAIAAADLARLRHGLRDFETGEGSPAPGPEDATAGPLQDRPFRWSPAGELARMIRAFAAGAAMARQKLQARLDADDGVFDALPQPLILIDDTRQIVRLNRMARRLIGSDTGRSLPAGQGPTGVDLASVLRDPALLEAVDHALAGQGRDDPPKSPPNFPTKSQTETPNDLRADLRGERHDQHHAEALHETLNTIAGRSFAFDIEPLPRGGPGNARFLIVLFDLTDRRKAEQMRADFVANVSHELRTPLATLIGFIETLQGPAQGDRKATREFLDLMQQDAARMERLVRDLLSLSAIEMVEHSVPDTPVDLRSIAERVASLMRIEAGRRNMTIAIESGPDLRPVTGDADQLAQLLQNLVANAVKYGREGTRITIRLQRESPAPSATEGLCLSVSDQGEGIAPEHIPRLTERFYRVDTARSRKIGGTGLGLAIVKHIVSRHRGTLRIESLPGEGSTFTVHLPAHEPGKAADAEQAGTPAP